MNVLGVDVGGVIIDKVNDGTDTSFFSDNYLKTTAVPDAFETLAKLNEIFKGNVVIVSKAGKNTASKTLKWMQHHNFHNITKIPDGKIYFCQKRAEKAPICEKLGITHFIDDKLEVLNYLTTVPHKYLFMADKKDKEAAKSPIEIMDSWQEVLKLV